MSSTRRIISAASVAEIRACSFTRRHSVTPIFYISSTLPSNILIPALWLPLLTSARKFVISSAASYPPFSQMIVGSWRNARAKASTAIAYFPLSDFASSSTARDILISELPPPRIHLWFLQAATKTQIASWSDRSASSRMC